MSNPADKRVLIVDDEEDVRFFLQSVLEDAGYGVEIAVDGEDGLTKARANPPDAISLDLVMPRKSGAKFFRAIRNDAALKDIPVVLVTAHARDDAGKKDFDEIMSAETVPGPETYLACIERALTTKGVKTFVTPKGDDPAQADLKSELSELIDQASPEDLERALALLKKQGG